MQLLRSLLAGLKAICATFAPPRRLAWVEAAEPVSDGRARPTWDVSWFGPAPARSSDAIRGRCSCNRRSVLSFFRRWKVPDRPPPGISLSARQCMKLRVAIRMIASLVRLTVGLQTIVLRLQL
jgi:hypothetical protein